MAVLWEGHVSGRRRRLLTPTPTGNPTTMQRPTGWPDGGRKWSLPRPTAGGVIGRTPGGQGSGAGSRLGSIPAIGEARPQPTAPKRRCCPYRVGQPRRLRYSIVHLRERIRCWVRAGADPGRRTGHDCAGPRRPVRCVHVRTDPALTRTGRHAGRTLPVQGITSQSPQLHSGSGAPTVWLRRTLCGNPCTSRT